MKHRTTICFAAAVMGCATACAQQVTIYGLVDEGVEYVHGSDGGAGTKVNDWRVGAATAPSRLGFRGSEDLGGGLKALFTMESGMSVDTGALSQGSRIFGRQAFVGLSSAYGTLSFGRQYTMRYWSMWDTDLFGSGAHGLGTLDTGIPNARADNSVSYRVDHAGFGGGVNYSVGRDTVAGNNPAATGCAGETANSKQCREVSVLGKYDGADWGVASAFERLYGGTAATYGGLTSPDRTDDRFTLGGYVKTATSKVAVGWLRRNNDGNPATPKSDLAWLAGSFAMYAPFTVDAMVAGIKFKDSEDKAALLTLRGNYWFSKRTSVYLSSAFVNNGGTLALAASSNAPATLPLPGGSQSSFMAGVRHTF